MLRRSKTSLRTSQTRRRPNLSDSSACRNRRRVRSSSRRRTLFHPCSPAVPAVWRIHRPPARYHTLRDSRSAPAEPHHRRAARPRADRRTASASVPIRPRSAEAHVAIHRPPIDTTRARRDAPSVFPSFPRIARVLTPSPTSRARRTRRRARAPLMPTMRIHRTRLSPRLSRRSRAVLLAHLLRRRLLPSTTASIGASHRARRPCDARRWRVGSFIVARARVYTTFLHRLKIIRIRGLRPPLGQHAHTRAPPIPRPRAVVRFPAHRPARPRVPPTDAANTFAPVPPPLSRAHRARSPRSIESFIHSCGPPRDVASRAHRRDARLHPPRCDGARSRPTTRASGRVKFYPPLDRPRSARRWTRTKPWTADDDFIATAVERYPG